MDVESEQSFHDLEQRYITLKKEHDLVLVDKDSLQAKVSTLQGFLDQNAQQLSLAERKVNDHNLELVQRDKLVQDLSSANEELNDRCRRRSDECDRLRDELKAQAAELVTLQTRLKDSQLNLNEFQTNTLPTQYELTKTVHEKNLLVEQVKYLEEEVRKKTLDDRTFRAESSNKIHELEVALSQATTQAEDAARQLATVKDSHDSQSEKIDLYLSQLKESERNAIEKQSAFLSELESLKRLVELYKRYFEDATAKVTELEQHEEVMRETNANVLKGLRDKVTQQLTEAENAATKQRTELESKVKDLEAQLAAAQEAASNRSVVAFVEGGPSVSSSSSAHASNADSVLAIENFDGIGITELYDRVVKTEKELYAERSKRREVELYMQQILKDVESKAPIIAAQRRDYHRVVESHTALTRRLDALVAENLEIKQTLHSMRQHTQEAEEEAHVLAEHNADLSRQVQNLLKRSMGVEFGNDGSSSQAARVESDTPSGVISEYLVTFDTIEELQQRNAELLRVVRKLSRDQEQLSQQQAMITQHGEGENEGMDVDTPTSSRALVPAQGHSGQANHNQALQAALEELGKMREARQRTEEMVSVLTQQRDMYRSMAEGDTSVFRVSSPAARSPGAGLFGAQTPAAGSSSAASNETAAADNLWHTAAVRELQSKLSQVEDDRRRIQERLTRFEEAEKLLNESLDKVRKEATAARLEAAQGASEARFQRERAERLETTLASTQQESASALQRRLEMERTLLEAGKEARGKEDRIAELYEQLRVSQDSQRRAEIEAEVARASETRLIAQIAEAREETRRHVSLVEHINRIESGLQSRVEAEKEALAAENESLKASFDTMRKQLDDRTLLDEQRAKVAEEEIRSIRSRLEQKTAEYASISEQLAREQITAHAAQERASLLERQLSLAQERVTHAQGSQIIESSMASDYTAKELALERAQAEISALREQVASTEVHAEQFRKISAVNEAALKDLRAKAAAAQTAQEAEVAKMREELEAAQKDMHDHRTHSQGLLQEAEDAGEQLRSFTAESAETVRKLEEALALLRQECDQLKAQGATVSGEIARYQDAAHAAHQNYERELQLHATAERELSELRRQIEETKQALQHEQQRTSQLSADCIRKETQLTEERAKFQLENKDLNEHVKGLQYTNDLLHTQVQSYGLQIERLQEQRMFHAGLSSSVAASSSSAPTVASASAPAAAASSDAVTMSEGDETVPAQTVAESVVDSQLTQPLPSQSTEADLTATTPVAPASTVDSSVADAPYDEMSELRKSTSEMREVLRYMKREKDMLQAKLSVSETENTRLVSELQSLRRSLDEVRVELKRELDKRVPLRNAEEFNHLMSEVNQLNLYRESNQHMRAENEDLSKRLAATAAALTEAKNAAAPLEDTIRKLSAEKESMEMVNDQLTNDVAYWRTRLQTLISRYNDVDPEEHRLLKTKLEEVTAALAEAQQALETQREAQRVAAEEAVTGADAKDKEIISLKAQVTGAETTANKLRETCRTFKERFESLRSQLKESEAKLVAEKQNAANLEAQITEAKAQVSSLTESLAAVNAAKSQVDAQLAAAGATPAGGAPAGGAAATAAARRKRPAPGSAPAAAAAAAASTDAASAAVPPATPATAAVPTTTPAAEAATAPVTSAAVTPAAAPPAATTAAPVDRAAKMKEGLLRKKQAAEKAAAEKAAAAAAVAAASMETPAPAVTEVTTTSAPAADAVTGKRAAPEESAPVVAVTESTTTAATGASTTPAAKKRRPLPPTPPAAGTEAETVASAAPVAVAATPAVVVEPVASPAKPVVEEQTADTAVEMSADQEVVDLVTSEAESGEIVEDAEPVVAPVAASVAAVVAPAAEAATSQPVVAEAPAKEQAAVTTAPKVGSGNPFAGAAATTTPSTGIFGSSASMFKSTLAAPTATSGAETATSTSPVAATTTGTSFFGGAPSGPFSAPAAAKSGLFGTAFGAPPATNTAPTNNPWGAAKSLNPTASAFAPASTTGFGTFGAPSTPAGTGVFGKSPFSAATTAAPASSSLWGSASAPKTGILKSTSSGALDATAGAPSATSASASASASTGAESGSSTVAILASAPTSGPEYQKRIEARAARFAQSAATPATATTTATAPAVSAAPVSNPFGTPKPAVVSAPVVVEPVAESQLAPIEEEYAEEGELDEADMTAEEGQEDIDATWDESNAESGDYEEGEI